MAIEDLPDGLPEGVYEYEAHIQALADFVKREATDIYDIYEVPVEGVIEDIIRKLAREEE